MASFWLALYRLGIKQIPFIFLHNIRLPPFSTFFHISTFPPHRQHLCWQPPLCPFCATYPQPQISWQFPVSNDDLFLSPHVYHDDNSSLSFFILYQRRWPDNSNHFNYFLNKEIFEAFNFLIILPVIHDLHLALAFFEWEYLPSFLFFFWFNDETSPEFQKFQIKISQFFRSSSLASIK